MSAHHPSCKPSDRDLIWFCNQCGAKESAGDLEEQLAAEREKYAQEADIFTKHIFELAQELAAERDKRMAAELENDRLYQQIAFDKEQLAAEREKVEIAERSAKAWEEDAKRYATNSEDAQKQLAAEREAAQALCKIYFDIAAEVIGEDEVRRRREAALPEAKKQLAAERQKVTEANA